MLLWLWMAGVGTVSAHDTEPDENAKTDNTEKKRLRLKKQRDVDALPEEDEQEEVEKPLPEEDTGFAMLEPPEIEQAPIFPKGLSPTEEFEVVLEASAPDATKQEAKSKSSSSRSTQYREKKQINARVSTKRMFESLEDDCPPEVVEPLADIGGLTVVHRSCMEVKIGSSTDRPLRNQTLPRYDRQCVGQGRRLLGGPCRAPPHRRRSGQCKPRAAP